MYTSNRVLVVKDAVLVASPMEEKRRQRMRRSVKKVFDSERFLKTAFLPRGGTKKQRSWARRRRRHHHHHHHRCLALEVVFFFFFFFFFVYIARRLCARLYSAHFERKKEKVQFLFFFFGFQLKTSLDIFFATFLRTNRSRELLP